MERNEKTAFLLVLASEGLGIKETALILAAGERQHGAERAVHVLGGEGAIAITGGFPGPPVGRADERAKQAGGEQRLLEDVLALEVAELVAEDEFYLGR